MNLWIPITAIVVTIAATAVLWRLLRWGGRWMLYRMCRTVPVETGQCWDFGHGHIEKVYATSDHWVMTETHNSRRTSWRCSVRYAPDEWVSWVQRCRAFLVEIPPQ